MPNRLADEASLYLRQHADNPVDWWPWCDEAFAEARERDVPVLLSVGYSSCHWCHVMAHESFEDASTAGIVNADFVPVKVDREERPDVDALYMDATVAMTGHGGWPMTVFLTPAGDPFWAGTYFPPEPRQGMPSFIQVLEGVTDAWRERRDEVQRAAAQLAEGIQAQSDRIAGEPPAGREAIDAALAILPRLYDEGHGGFGGAPKFPPSLTLDFLLRRAWADPAAVEARRMSAGTLRAMADGGVFDQVGGGFHRYSVDDIWLVPHFEKMLYDNAMLLGDYALAATVLHDDAYAVIAARIADYLLREMRVEGGAFAAAQDADSPGGEGAFFTWTPSEIGGVLAPDAAAAVMARYGVTDRGNFEGRTILHVAGPRDPLADASLPALYAARAARPAPARDDKVIASWNGLAIRALADAGRLLDQPDWIHSAREAARFVLDEMVVDGRLMRVHADGRARHLGTLDDHADMADGLLALYATDFDPAWLEAATHLARVMVELFAAPDGGFYLAGGDAPALVARTRDIEDHPTPAGNAQAAWVLANLSLLTGDGRMWSLAEGAVRLAGDGPGKWPTGYGRTLATMDLLTTRPMEIAVAGPLDDPAAMALVDAARAAMGPYAVLAAGDPADPRAAAAAPLLADRPLVDGRPAAYVCSGFACQAPVTAPADLAEALRR